MPQLEALSLDEPLGAPPDNVVAELPPLPKLRGLYLTQPAHRCRRIDRLFSLEALRITEGCIDEQVLREISVLPNLRELSLNGLSESADLSFLPSRLQLSALDLYHSEVGGAALKSIGQCPRLKELSLYFCRVDGSGMRHLSGLAHLETLNLEYTNVGTADLEAMATLKRLRELKLTNTEVAGDLRFMSSLESLERLKLYNTKVKGADLASLVGLAHLRSLDLGYTDIGANGRVYLRQMKQLQWLRVSNCDEDELEALRAALPECEIHRH
jgi:internalin A